MYDIPDTYWEENSKWHLIVIENTDKRSLPKDFIDKYIEIVDWVKTNIQAFHKHSRWTIDHTCIKVKLRYEKDYLTFLLRWS